MVAFDSRTCGNCLHQYISTPNPRTLTQTSTRAFFASAVAGWQALDLATADAWRAAAALIPWYDRLGKPIELSGKNFWVKVQTSRLLANYAMDPGFQPKSTSDPPRPPPFPLSDPSSPLRSRPLSTPTTNPFSCASPAPLAPRPATPQRATFD